MPGTTTDRFRDWFWRPPRPHGETMFDRRVSALELLYDLVYVSVVGQLAHHLAEHATRRGVVEFAIVFGLVWIAWTNGSLYLELHGQPDGRTRAYVFIQMGILAVMAVFASDAGSGGGRGFAVTYALFLVVATWLWYTVRERDRTSHQEFLRDTARYITGMILAFAIIVASAFLSADQRLIAWAIAGTVWMAMWFALAGSWGAPNSAVAPTDSMVERFGLFTIIVLGEVVLGVVSGLSGATRDTTTIATGLIALVVGFGLWWIYFDVIGGRLPRSGQGGLRNWLLGHCPLAMAIAAAGAGMVGLIEHAHDDRTPRATALLLCGSVSTSLIATILILWSLSDAARLAGVFRPLSWAMAIAAAVALGVGWARPAPWLLALLLVAILVLLWVFTVRKFLVAGEWGHDVHHGH